MKKTLLTILICAGASQMVVAQERAVAKGKNSINLYYGLSLSKAVYKAVIDEAAVSGLTYGGIGPLGLVYEHMFTESIGLGAELGYSTFTMDYLEPDYNPTTGLMQDYKAQWKFSTIRAMVRANFHFAKSPNFDAYFLLSAGYRKSSFEFNYDSPYYTESVNWGGFIPFGIKPGLGLRYFFAGPIGLNIEIAAGTPVMCGGLSLRF